jgi:hypothetical protein
MCLWRTRWEASTLSVMYRSRYYLFHWRKFICLSFLFCYSQRVLKRLNYCRSTFFWQLRNIAKNIGRQNGVFFASQGVWGRGAGILNLETQNTCLLSKWLFKLINEDVMWQNMLKMKYVKNKCLTQIEKWSGDLHFWSGLMEVKNTLLQYGRFKVNNGHQTRFW